jgi:BolA protein
MTEVRINMIRECLVKSLAPTHLEIEDESYLHAGHAGAEDGRGHFVVTISSEAFSGQPLLKRHRMVYEALGELMQTDIHALTIKATGDIQ